MPQPNVNKLQRKVRDKAILNDYCAGLTYSQLSEKYSLTPGAFTPILNSKQAIRLREAVFYRRTAGFAGRASTFLTHNRTPILV